MEHQNKTSETNICQIFNLVKLVEEDFHNQQDIISIKIDQEIVKFYVINVMTRVLCK